MMPSKKKLDIIIIVFYIQTLFWFTHIFIPSCTSNLPLRLICLLFWLLLNLFFFDVCLLISVSSDFGVCFCSWCLKCLISFFYYKLLIFLGKSSMELALFPIGNLLHPSLFSCYLTCLFFTAFKVFSLSLALSNLTMMCVGALGF